MVTFHQFAKKNRGPSHRTGDRGNLSPHHSWKNIHWHRVGEEHRNQIEKVLDFSISTFSDKNGNPQPEELKITLPEPENRFDEDGRFQIGFNF